MPLYARSVVMLTTYRGHGMLPRYLARFYNFTEIGYQFPGRYIGEELVYANHYANGRLIATEEFGRKFSSMLLAIQRLQPAILHLPIAMAVLFAVVRNRRKYDLLIIGALSPVSIALKILGIAKRTIMISCDAYFVQGGLLTKSIHSAEIAMEKDLQNSVDEVWYVTPRLLKHAHRIIKNPMVVRKVVPYCVDTNWLTWRRSKNLDRFTVVYFGAVVPGRGLELIIGSMVDVRKSVPEAKFRIVGEGEPEFEGFLRKKVEQSGLRNAVEFVRFEPNATNNPRNVATCALGMAIYDDIQLSILYTDSIKIKEYLGCGLPVLVSKRVPLSQEIVEANAGSAVANEEAEISEAIKRYLTVDDFWHEKSAGAASLAHKYDYLKVYASQLAHD